MTKVKSATAQKWAEFLRKLPFRMAIGRFGIWLAAVGRVLQVRCANWNSEFRLKTELSPLNGDYVTIYLSEPVTEDPFLSFDSPKCQRNKMPALIEGLFGIKGIVKMSLQPYELKVVKGRVYEWHELLPEIEKTILMHLTTPGTAAE